MKKRISALIATVMAFTMVIGLAACGGGNTNATSTPNPTPTTGAEATKTPDPTQGASDDSKLDGTYNITVWVSESTGVDDLTKTQIDRFMEKHPGIVINATIEGVSESQSASQMITSVEDGADIFCFAQDQLARLVQAGALAALGEAAANTVKSSNDATSIKAATVGDKIYCYPLTSDNGYFMVYDKSVIKESSLNDLAKIVADCEAAKRNFSMEIGTSAWYTASFFFGTGCTSDWTTEEVDGKMKFTAVKDDFNSAKGLAAMKGMQIVTKSDYYVSSSSESDFAAATPSAVVIAGTWITAKAKEILGDNYAAAKLPCFTVDGQTYQMGSYSGCKLMGVKPQVDAKKAAVLQMLALELTNGDCQLERFDLVGWGPSNLDAQKDDLVASDVALQALAAQNEFAIPQGQIHGKWWDDAKLLGVASKNANTDAELQEALDAYKKAIDGYFDIPADEANAFTVIGAFDGHNWDADIAMSQNPTGVWHSDKIAFKAGDEFQVRQGKAWDVQFGAVGADGFSTKDNFKIEEDGYYFVKLVFDEAAGTGVVSVNKYDEVFGWTVIGALAGTNWDKDFTMSIQADGTWLSDDVFDLKANDELKCRFGLGWDESIGDGAGNLVVTADGKFQVKCDVENNKIELIAK